MLNRLISTTDAEGGQVSFEYDANGNLINALQDYFFDKVTDCYTLYEIDTMLLSAARISQEKYDQQYKSIMTQFIYDWRSSNDHRYDYMFHVENFEKNILPNYRDRLYMIYEEFENYVAN